MKIIARAVGVFFSLLGIWVLAEHEKSQYLAGIQIEPQSHIGMAVLGAAFLISAVVLITGTRSRDF